MLVSTPEVSNFCFFLFLLKKKKPSEIQPVDLDSCLGTIWISVSKFPRRAKISGWIEVLLLMAPSTCKRENQLYIDQICLIKLARQVMATTWKSTGHSENPFHLNKNANYPQGYCSDFPEVESHAPALERLGRLRIRVGIFTLIWLEIGTHSPAGWLLICSI